MTKRSALIILIIGMAFSCYASERIWLNAKINGKSVHLCFDSGSNGNLLSLQTMKKLGLKFIPAPPDASSPGILAGETESCILTFDDGIGCSTKFCILDVPAYTSLDKDFDGLIGWWIMSQNILRIDAVAGTLTTLPKVPKQAARWDKFSILALTNSGALDLQIPHAGRTNGVLCIDTGVDCGLALPDKEWKRWRESHPHAPTTLDAAYTPSDGFFVTEEAWADHIAIGPLILTNVPIRHAGPFGAIKWGSQYEGTLGLAALKRLDTIVDGKNGLAYLQAKTTKPLAYRHNRLGAIFLATENHTNQAVARVVEGGPAYEAGVRNGDILLQVGKIVIKGLSADWLDQFFLPVGTQLNLTLERDRKTFNTTATLREILQPSSDKKK